MSFRKINLKKLKTLKNPQIFGESVQRQNKNQIIKFILWNNFKFYRVNKIINR